VIRWLLCCATIAAATAGEVLHHDILAPPAIPSDAPSALWSRVVNVSAVPLRFSAEQDMRFRYDDLTLWARRDGAESAIRLRWPKGVYNNLPFIIEGAPDGIPVPHNHAVTLLPGEGYVRRLRLSSAWTMDDPALADMTEVRFGPMPPATGSYVVPKVPEATSPESPDQADQPVTWKRLLAPAGPATGAAHAIVGPAVSLPVLPVPVVTVRAPDQLRPPAVAVRIEPSSVAGMQGMQDLVLIIGNDYAPSWDHDHWTPHPLRLDQDSLRAEGWTVQYVIDGKPVVIPPRDADPGWRAPQELAFGEYLSFTRSAALQDKRPALEITVPARWSWEPDGELPRCDLAITVTWPEPAPAP
jgi:hypothetical protein